MTREGWGEGRTTISLSFRTTASAADSISRQLFKKKFFSSYGTQESVPKPP